jgi:hypothetical protein
MRTVIAALIALLVTTAALGEGLDERPVKVPAYQSIPRIGWYASPEEYEAALRDARFRLTRVSYESDGLTVFAYVYAPAETPKVKQPVIVFNHGSYTWNEFAGEADHHLYGWMAERDAQAIEWFRRHLKK